MHAYMCACSYVCLLNLCWLFHSRSLVFAAVLRVPCCTSRRRAPWCKAQRHPMSQDVCPAQPRRQFSARSVQCLAAPTLGCARPLKCPTASALGVFDTRPLCRSVALVLRSPTHPLASPPRGLSNVLPQFPLRSIVQRSAFLLGHSRQAAPVLDGSNAQSLQCFVAPAIVLSGTRPTWLSVTSGLGAQPLQSLTTPVLGFSGARLFQRSAVLLLASAALVLTRFSSLGGSLLCSASSGTRSLWRPELFLALGRSAL